MLICSDELAGLEGGWAEVYFYWHGIINKGEVRLAKIDHITSYGNTTVYLDNWQCTVHDGVMVEERWKPEDKNQLSKEWTWWDVWFSSRLYDVDKLDNGTIVIRSYKIDSNQIHVQRNMDMVMIIHPENLSREEILARVKGMEPPDLDKLYWRSF